MEPSPSGLQGMHWTVLSVLKQYGAVSLDFLARTAKLQRKDVEEAVHRLEEDGTVQQRDDVVTLNRQR
jgi:biotin operon repressor